MIPKDERRVNLFEMWLNFQNNRNNDSATFDKAHGIQGGKTAESRYLIFKKELFEL